MILIIEILKLIVSKFSISGDRKTITFIKADVPVKEIAMIRRRC